MYYVENRKHAVREKQTYVVKQVSKKLCVPTLTYGVIHLKLAKLMIFYASFCVFFFLHFYYYTLRLYFIRVHFLVLYNKQ